MTADRARAVLVLAAGLGAGLLCAWRVDSPLRIRTLPAPVATSPAQAVSLKPRAPSSPLPLRLVDTGGVGIPADAEGWGRDYFHNTQAFHDLILLEPPYVDERAFRGVQEDWGRYLDRMAAYGNNGVVVGVFLELLDFDRLPGGKPVYEAGSPYRERHRVLRERFAELFGAARARGFRVLLKTDMLTLTEPLERHLRATAGGLDPRDPELWSVYRAGFEELFATQPDVDGVVIRVGEAGPLFNRPGWPYWSRFQVADVPALRTMLHELLPVFERSGKLLVLRTWSVGPGPLGSLHTDPRTYDAVLADIDSESLIVSTKYLQGDFFSFLPLNPTLMHGRQRRIVEFQARREFEGFGAFPNYMAVTHGHALREIMARNPQVVGTWLWTQDGGPIRAGPLSLYPLHGFWQWIDANVYATSRLAADPQADIGAVTRDWVTRELGGDPEVTAAVSRILLRSRDVVEGGFYVRPFARQRVRLGAVEVPPLLWIMEWDLVGGWSAALSTIYHLVGEERTAAVAEGFEAVATIRDSRLGLERLEGKLAHHREAYQAMRGSLLYEESLLQALAWYRSAFLDFYRWLDTGERAALDRWRRSSEEYRSARAAHRARYEGDLDFPAFDFAPADSAVALAGRNQAIAWLARGTLALIAALYLLRRRLPQRGWTTAAPVLASATLATGALMSFTSWPLALLPLVLLPAFGAGLWLGWGRAAEVPAALSSFLLPVALLLAAMSVRGPLHFWFLFWTAPAFRITFLTLFIALHVWTLYAALRVGRALTGRAGAAWGGLSAATGLTLLAAAALLPSTEAALGALHSPLALLPLTFAVVLGIVTYLGVPAWLAPYPAAAGVLLLGLGRLLARRRGPGAARG